jgi:hypothetical protein
MSTAKWQNIAGSKNFFTKKSKKFSINFLDFENIQFPTSHLETETPLGLVLH